MDANTREAEIAFANGAWCNTRIVTGAITGPVSGDSLARARGAYGEGVSE